MLGFLFSLALFLPGVQQGVQGAEAWQAEWERTIKAAEQEGEFTYYTVGEFNFLSEFEKKFPRIKVRVVQGRGIELLARMIAFRTAACAPAGW